MLKSDTKAVWELTSQTNLEQNFTLKFSDRFWLRLTYENVTGTATVELVDKKNRDKILYHAVNAHTNSIIHAQQWAGIDVTTRLHNIAAECKYIESSLMENDAWQELAGQNL